MLESSAATRAGRDRKVGPSNRWIAASITSMPCTRPRKSISRPSASAARAASARPSGPGPAPAGGCQAPAAASAKRPRAGGHQPVGGRPAPAVQPGPAARLAAAQHEGEQDQGQAGEQRGERHAGRPVIGADSQEALEDHHPGRQEARQDAPAGCPQAVAPGLAGRRLLVGHLEDLDDLARGVDPCPGGAASRRFRPSRPISCPAAGRRPPGRAG